MGTFRVEVLLNLVCLIIGWTICGYIEYSALDSQYTYGIGSISFPAQPQCLLRTILADLVISTFCVRFPKWSNILYMVNPKSLFFLDRFCHFLWSVPFGATPYIWLSYFHRHLTVDSWQFIFFLYILCYRRSDALRFRILFGFWLYNLLLHLQYVPATMTFYSTFRIDGGDSNRWQTLVLATSSIKCNE